MTIFAISHQHALVDAADNVYFLSHNGTLIGQAKADVQKRAFAVEFT